jgi:serine/threonine protein kinase
MPENRPVRPLPPPPPPISRRTNPSSASISLNSRRCPACGARYPADFRVCPRDATPLEDAPEGEDPLIGQTLDNTYEITRVLGEGGMGRVYEARHARLHKKRFAIKLLHQDMARQPDIVTRFQREAEASSAIGHPNVVDVYDVNVTSDGQPYIVAELLQGEQLGDCLERLGRLTVPDAVRVLRQVCQALGAAHAQGIVHRDVKPENVFLTGNVSNIAEAQVKVLDFGISKVADGGNEQLTKTGTVMGTPDYMAPEQARGDRVDARADIYATGAILYRAVTGHKPFEAPDPMATLTAVLVQEPERPTTHDPSIPLTLELVIQRAMAKKVGDRYTSMAELDQELAAFDTAPVISPTSATDPAPPATVGPGSVDRATKTKTLFTHVSPRSLGEAMEETTRSVRLARPGILFFTTLGLFWVLINVSVASGAAIRLARGTESDLSGAEAVMALVGVLAALATPIWLWVRHLRTEIWPSTPRSVQWMGRLRMAVLFSSAAYGITALLVQMFEVIVARHSLGVARPGWALLTFLVAMAVASLTWFLTRPVPREDP